MRGVAVSIRTGPLASRLALLFIEIIYAPFLSAHFPVWDIGNGHEHERMSSGK